MDDSVSPLLFFIPKNRMGHVSTTLWYKACCFFRQVQRRYFSRNLFFPKSPAFWHFSEFASSGVPSIGDHALVHKDDAVGNLGQNSSRGNDHHGHEFISAGEKMMTFTSPVSSGSSAERLIKKHLRVQHQHAQSQPSDTDRRKADTDTPFLFL